MKNSSEKSNNKKAFIIVVVAIVVLILSGVGYLGRLWYLNYSGEKKYQNIESYYDNDAHKSDKAELPKNPVDFEKLQKVNGDLYSWIKVPGTRVNYPIAQGADDTFYLHHDYNKNYLFAGTIYTELCNSKAYDDPVTVIYGHNMYTSEGTMFTTLHYFEEADFFKAHRTFTIYTNGHILTYEIFSAFKYDNRHIMNSFDFTHSDVLESFQKMLLSPQSAVKNVSSVSLNKDSKIVILSTCCSGEKNLRLLVCGVLVKDEQTQ